MSQTAISFGMYEEVRDYAELLDDVLVNIKSLNLVNTEQKRLMLGEFLENIVNGSTANLTARYIGLTLNSKHKRLKNNLLKIAYKLKNIEGGLRLDQNEINSLEELARFLEGEQAEAAARIRGER